MNQMIPRFQLLLDVHGEAVTHKHLLILTNGVMSLHGCERLIGSFWVTRSDLMYDFLRREVQTNPPQLFDQRYHESSFDLYLQPQRNGYEDYHIPIGRILNVAIPSQDVFAHDLATATKA